GLVKCSSSNGQRLRISDDELNAIAGSSRLRRAHVCGRSIGPRDAHRRKGLREYEGERTDARTYIENGLLLTNSRKLSEKWRELAAPSAHESLIAVTLCEDRGALLHSIGNRPQECLSHQSIPGPNDSQLGKFARGRQDEIA